MNPTWDRLDENGIPFSPRWNVQVASGAGLLCLPDPDAKDVCGKFPRAGGVPRGKPACNDLATAEHPVADVVHGVPCSLGRGLEFFPGHLNFVPATYHGLIYFENHSWPDDDLDFELLPLETDQGVWKLRRHALTTSRRLEEGLVPEAPLAELMRSKGLDYPLHVEAKAEESLEHFGQEWWVRFRQANKEERRQMLSGRPAVVTGLLGLDVEHGAISEIHPTHALAVQTRCGRTGGDAEGPYVDNWVFFLRNSGNEGWCSQWDLQHRLDPPSGVFTIALPTAFSGVMERAELASTSEIVANVAGVERSALEVKGAALVLRFRWPAGLPPDGIVRVHGTLDVRWWPKPGAAAACLDVAQAVQTSPADPVSASAKPGPPEEKDESAEAFLRALGGPRPRGVAGPTAFRIQAAAAASDQATVSVQDIPEVALPIGQGPCPGHASSCDPRLRAVVVDRTTEAPALARAARQDQEARQLCELAEARNREVLPPEIDRDRLTKLLEACRNRGVTSP
jgi:hypothetical protein